MLFFLVTCEEEKDLNKYLDSSYTSVVEFISTEIANKFCSGCEVVKCGTIHRAFYNKTVKWFIYNWWN